jgi:HAE1 family hydrophobic/amphiphilic exporter-1
MFSKFFIDRPIFATVLALLIVVAGLVTLGILPIAQYPDITPPTVQVSAVYPGANAQTVAQTEWTECFTCPPTPAHRALTLLPLLLP